MTTTLSVMPFTETADPNHYYYFFNSKNSPETNYSINLEGSADSGSKPLRAAYVLIDNHIQSTTITLQSDIWFVIIPPYAVQNVKFPDFASNVSITLSGPNLDIGFVFSTTDTGAPPSSVKTVTVAG